MNPHASLARLMAEYAHIDWARNPPKACLALDHVVDERKPWDITERYLNVMCASLRDGHFGAKVIYVDDRSRKGHSQITVFRPDGQIRGRLDGERITRFRCGLMAALTIRNFFGPDVPLARLRVGFVGAGRINAQTADVLAELGMPGRNMVAMGRPTKPAPDVENFPFGCWGTNDPAELAACDVVISCTTNDDRPGAYRVGDFQVGKRRPYLFIAQDGGYALGPEFRRLPSFCDHPEQVWRHAKPGDTYDFPWDVPDPASLTQDLNSGQFDVAAWDTPVVVYLSGICLADLVAAIDDLEGMEALAGLPKPLPRTPTFYARGVGGAAMPILPGLAEVRRNGSY